MWVYTVCISCKLVWVILVCVAVLHPLNNEVLFSRSLTTIMFLDKPPECSLTSFSAFLPTITFLQSVEEKFFHGRTCGSNTGQLAFQEDMTSLPQLAIG